MSNAISVEAFLEWWRNSDRLERPIQPVNNDTIMNVIDEMESLHSALLSISVADKTLLIGASDGIFTATALLGADEFFDMIGDASAQDFMSIVQGGQRVEIPRKYHISKGRALEVAIAFLAAGTVHTETGWAKQE